jgi:hypothetical protein
MWGVRGGGHVEGQGRRPWRVRGGGRVEAQREEAMEAQREEAVEGQGRRPWRVRGGGPPRRALTYLDAASSSYFRRSSSSSVCVAFRAGEQYQGGVRSPS